MHFLDQVFNLAKEGFVEFAGALHIEGQDRDALPLSELGDLGGSTK